jgi:hypothetical protein
MLEEFDIPVAKVHVCVRDNAAAMVKGVRNTGIADIGCTIHTVQLIIVDCLFEQRSIKDMIVRARRLCTHFNHSALAHQKLAAIQAETETTALKPKQDVPTRCVVNQFTHVAK